MKKVDNKWEGRCETVIVCELLIIIKLQGADPGILLLAIVQIIFGGFRNR